MKDPAQDTYSEEETERRREAILKRMLNTPPQPRKGSKPKADAGKPKG